MLYNVRVETPIARSFRVDQVRGMFDLPNGVVAGDEFSCEIPDAGEPWQIGLIVGPSGSGKTTLAQAAFPDLITKRSPWPAGAAVVDAFDEALSIREITATLAAVGFSSPPSWIKPYAVLSNGEQFRCDLAKAILSARPGAVVAMDEFTSLVDRTVAKIGSAALAKEIRRDPRRRFVAVTCHYDVREWLAPDWVVDMATCTLARGRLCRPGIDLEIFPARREQWRTFQRYHYLDATVHREAKCFVAAVNGSPAALVAVVHFPHPVRPGWREHRLVTLPDFQGVGIGGALSDFVGSMYAATGRPYRCVSSHPAVYYYRQHRPHLWRATRFGRVKPNSRVGGVSRNGQSRGRITASFEYVGPWRADEARLFGVTR